MRREGDAVSLPMKLQSCSPGSVSVARHRPEFFSHAEPPSKPSHVASMMPHASMGKVEVTHNHMVARPHIHRQEVVVVGEVVVPADHLLNVRSNRRDLIPLCGDAFD